MKRKRFFCELFQEQNRVYFMTKIFDLNNQKKKKTIGISVKFLENGETTICIDSAIIPKKDERPEDNIEKSIEEWKCHAWSASYPRVGIRRVARFRYNANGIRNNRGMSCSLFQSFHCIGLVTPVIGAWLDVRIFSSFVPMNSTFRRFRKSSYSIIRQSCLIRIQKTMTLQFWKSERNEILVFATRKIYMI